MLLRTVGLCCVMALSGQVFAQKKAVQNNSDIVGKWKTIDEQTGYSRADVEIVKNADQTYTGKIITIRPLPFKPLVETCTQCKGKMKNARYVGLEILTGFKQDPNNPTEFIDGHVLDPLSGKIYKGKAKLQHNGQRLRMRGYVGISALGRSTTWIRTD